MANYTQKSYFVRHFYCNILNSTTFTFLNQGYLAYEELKAEELNAYKVIYKKNKESL